MVNSITQKMVNRIIIPKRVSKDLAEILGIIVGDGYVRKRPPFWLFIENASEERCYIDEHVISLFKKVFKIELKGRFFNRHGYKNVYGFYICSKKLVGFLNSLEVATTHDIIRVPLVIRNNKKLWKRFLRGYFDTDGYLNFYTYYGKYNFYPRVGFDTVSPLLAEDVIKILKEMEFKGSYWISPIRGKSKSPTHHFEIKGIENLKKWMKEIGFGNFGKLSRYLIWEKFGFCPTNISLLDRINILKGNLNPNIYVNNKL